MITNRETPSRSLLEEALDELVESARENGVPDEALAEALRTRAAAIDEANETGGFAAGSDSVDGQR